MDKELNTAFHISEYVLDAKVDTAQLDIEQLQSLFELTEQEVMNIDIILVDISEKQEVAA